jgi:hypothetical protein
MPRGGKLKAGPAWDFDRSAGGPSDGRIANALIWGDGGGGTAYFVRGNHGTPIWWEDLFATPDFMMNWLDRWYELRQSEMVTPTWDPDATPLPAFSDANINRIIDHMADTMMESQERNFAQWPGARPRNAGQLKYSDKDGYEGEIEHIKGWLSARAAWIEEQFIFVPQYTPSEAEQSSPLTVSVDDGGNLFSPPITVYYTTDGTDPRQSGGEPNTTAIKLTGKKIDLTTSARVKSRRIETDYEADRWGPQLEWSGLAEQYYFVDTVPASSTNLVVSEIMYHPSEPSEAEIAAMHDDADDFEYIEVHNISNDRVDLSESRLRGDADFNFPDGTVLEPGEYAVVVANAAAFVMRYGDTARIIGDYSGRLGNGSGTIRLRNYNREASREFNYDDESPWPTEADGAGKSLVLNNPSSNPAADQPTNWVASTEANGTPGAGSEGGGNPGGDSAYDKWLTANFDAAQLADASISGLGADSDRDGMVTLAEYYFVGDPLEPDSNQLPKVALGQSGDIFILAYELRNGSGIDAKIELSEDLKVWTEASADQVSTLTTLAGGESNRATTTVQLSGNSRANYARFKLSLP